MADPVLAPSFSYEEFTQLVRHFADTIPDLLSRHPQTAPLAFDIEKLRLKSSLETRFTVAVIGQMRVGKSTLVNALIGRPLAPVGVTETTATINWFRHGSGEMCNRFRVHWGDGSTEDLPLDRATQWIGQQDNAKRTRALDFFADSDFLAIANIVDTPGTRSVVDVHTKATQGFLTEEQSPGSESPARETDGQDTDLGRQDAETKALAGQHESATLAYGGRADAVIYVINPVAREADRDILHFFGERTRLPGVSAYNSIAVVQKWEQLEPDPIKEVGKKCDRLRSQLQGKVADVLPVSGMLANLTKDLPLQTWNDVARLACESSEAAMVSLLRAPAYFCRDVPGAALDVATRTALYGRFVWAALRFTIWLARTKQIGDGYLLRQAILDASGIKRLQSLLQTRFFSLSSLIKASTALRKAWDPCTVALLRLRELARLRQEEQQLGQTSLATLSRFHGDPALKPVNDYITRSLAAVRNDLLQVEELREQLDLIKERAESNFRYLDQDIASLEALDDIPPPQLSAEERLELRHLFGEHGPDLHTRLMLASPLELAQANDRVWNRHDHWARKKASASGTLRLVCDHALNRIGIALDFLDSNHD